MARAGARRSCRDARSLRLPRCNACSGATLLAGCLRHGLRVETHTDGLGSLGVADTVNRQSLATQRQRFPN
jgi:hypothetical protein